MTTRTKDYLLTESGNWIARAGLNLINTQAIVLGGKTIIEHHVCIRGDLRPSHHGGSTGSSSAAAVLMGRYCRLAHHVTLSPPHKDRDRDTDYYPLKIGDYVVLGAHTTCQAAYIAPYVSIGAHCVIGNMVIIQSGCVVDAGTHVPDYTVLPPFSRVSGKPARVTGESPEVTVDVLRQQLRDHYATVVKTSTAASASAS